MLGVKVINSSYWISRVKRRMKTGIERGMDKWNGKWTQRWRRTLLIVSCLNYCFANNSLIYYNRNLRKLLKKLIFLMIPPLFSYVFFSCLINFRECCKKPRSERIKTIESYVFRYGKNFQVNNSDKNKMLTFKKNTFII